MRGPGSSFLAACLLVASTGCARGATVLELGPDDSVGVMRSAGEVLAVGVGRRARYDARASRELPEDQAYVLLLRGGSRVRTRLAAGVVREIVAARAGFVVLRVVYARGSGAVESHVSRLSLDGSERPLTSLGADVLGIFVDGDDRVYAYTASDVRVHSGSGGEWRPVDVIPGWKAPISRIVALDGGPLAVTGARSMAAVARVGEGPLFRRDLGGSGAPLRLGDAADSWWVVVPGENEQRVVQVDQAGVARASVTLREALVQAVHPWRGKLLLVCSGKGPDVHRTYFYEWDAPGGGALEGPFDLPDDTLHSAVWRGSLVSGGPGRKLFRRRLGGAG